MRNVSKRFVLAWVVVLAVACGGVTTTPTENTEKREVGTSAGGCVPGQSIACAGVGGCAGSQVCAAEGDHYLPCDCAPAPIDASPPPADAGVDASEALAARCKAPDTPALVPATISDAAGALAGQWWLCFGAAEFYYPVEFTADGHWYKLTDVGGTYQRNFGPETSGPFTITSVNGGFFDMTWSTATYTCCDYGFTGVIQTGGKMRLGGGDYIRLP